VVTSFEPSVASCDGDDAHERSDCFTASILRSREAATEVLLVDTSDYGTGLEPWKLPGSLRQLAELYGIGGGISKLPSCEDPVNPSQVCWFTRNVKPEYKTRIIASHYPALDGATLNGQGAANYVRAAAQREQTKPVEVVLPVHANAPAYKAFNIYDRLRNRSGTTCWFSAHTHTSRPGWTRWSVGSVHLDELNVGSTTDHPQNALIGTCPARQPVTLEITTRCEDIDLELQSTSTDERFQPITVRGEPVRQLDAMLGLTTAYREVESVTHYVATTRANLSRYLETARDPDRARICLARYAARREAGVAD
jgi:hypothetical protein